MIGIPKGTKDVLPDKSHIWQYAEGILRRTAADFCYDEIRFPTFEHTELFLRGVGDTTDIVNKEMYTFLDKGGRSVTLRPEGTASVVRSVIENGLYAGALPLKVYYIAPNFRYERPQAGRLREHHQFGVECFGTTSPAADAEVISLADTYLARLGIEGVSVSVNSIGCEKCRPGYHAALREYYGAHAESLCRDCKERLVKNPLRLLDCKEESCQILKPGAPKTLDWLCGECETHFSGLLAELSLLKIPHTVDTNIVRGLDYYTKTVFEFLSDRIGSQSAVCSGGRYDRLSETLGGPALPGLGFGSGIERLLMVMEAAGAPLPEKPVPDIFIAALGERAAKAASVLVLSLRRAGFSADRDSTGRSLKAQMKHAGRQGAKKLLIIGENELDSGFAELKDMAGGGSENIPLDADSLIGTLKGSTPTD